MKEQIYTLLRERFFVSDSLLNGEHDDTPLTGKLFNFDGIRMTYLFLEIEKLFSIKIDAAQILHYEFNTINGIIRTIEKQAVI